MKNRGCVFGAFWGGPWAPKCRSEFLERHYFGAILGAILNQKSQKRHPKRHAKFDVKKLLKINAKRLPKLCQNGDQNL